MVIYVLKSSSLSFALCFLYISTRQWLLYKYKKYKKMHFHFVREIFSEVHLYKLLMDCSCQTCLYAYIPPCNYGRWKL